MSSSLVPKRFCIETRRKGIRFSTNLLQDDLPWVEPLEVDKGKDEVDDGEGDEEDGQLPPQSGQQVKGLVLLGECPNVVPENQMFLCHFCSWRQHLCRIH